MADYNSIYTGEQIDEGVGIALAQPDKDAAQDAQIADFKNAVNEFGLSVNLFNPNDADNTTEKYINSNGTLQPSSVGSVSGYIPVIPGQTIQINPVIANSWYANFYDSNKILEQTISIRNVSKIVVPESAYFFRFTYLTSNKASIKINLVDAISDIAEMKIDAKAINNTGNCSEYKVKFLYTGGYYATLQSDGTYSGVFSKQVSGRVFGDKFPAPEVMTVKCLKSCRIAVIFANKDGRGYISTNRVDTSVMNAGDTISYSIKNLISEYRTLYAFPTCIASGITSDNVDEYVSVVCTEWDDSPYNISGKNVAVYHFGGSGNDWCFVRTPSDYNPKRPKPYPFVICNHGNGWVMDGSLSQANWTKRTMYVPLTDPDYIADPTEYNGTSDKSLWYSNPTIEALLTAGYIVCGCENYGDNLYGNNNCRNACVDFYNHMISNYNVEDRCYMIGASNGAMTSLNAAYLLQGAVKAMVLQYPLTCLLNQYNSNTSQQANIRAAYGIATSTPSQEELATAFRTHDPLTTNVVSNIKVGVIPPIKFWYSPDDQTANYQQNSIALYDLLVASGKVVEKVQVEGEHGDHRHFNPAAVVAWFDAN